MRLAPLALMFLLSCSKEKRAPLRVIASGGEATVADCKQLLKGTWHMPFVLAPTMNAAHEKLGNVEFPNDTIRMCGGGRVLLTNPPMYRAHCSVPMPFSKLAARCKEGEPETKELGPCGDKAALAQCREDAGDNDQCILVGKSRYYGEVRADERGIFNYHCVALSDAVPKSSLEQLSLAEYEKLWATEVVGFVDPWNTNSGATPRLSGRNEKLFIVPASSNLMGPFRALLRAKQAVHLCLLQDDGDHQACACSAPAQSYASAVDAMLAATKSIAVPDGAELTVEYQLPPDESTWQQNLSKDALMSYLWGKRPSNSWPLSARAQLEVSCQR